VQNLSGDIQLGVTEGPEAIVESTKVNWHDKCSLKTQKTLENLEVVVAEKGPGSFFRKTCKANLKIKVPARVALNLKNGAGDILVSGIQGEIEFKLGSGDVKIDSGTPSVKGTAGSGDIEILGEMGSTSLRTGSGDIRIELKNPIAKGEIDIKTGSGDAQITLPDTMKVLADFKAGSGQINSEFGNDSASEFKVSMRAGSGDLKILKKK
jgi:DUF4097 and DUF4098 domain-containing protein YvlB